MDKATDRLVPQQRQGGFFSSDQPISAPADDLLGRAGFARAVAAAIRAWKGRDSLVIALYGPWGSGKTSVKNLILNSLETPGETGPSVLEFNPWQITGQERLATAFFDEVGGVLGTKHTTPNSTSAARWKAYTASLTLGASFAKSLKTVLSSLGVPGSMVLGPLATVLENISAATAKGSDGLEAEAQSAQHSLSDAKNELASDLRKLERPILIVMDDIDRLSKDEIRLLFQLVKANADFPNLIYLLLFQRNVVEASLETVTGVSGREFLEKIVQVGFDMPRIERPRLEKLLFAGLDALLEGKDVGKGFNKHRWENLYHGGLRSFFRSIRDVNRFNLTLSFHVSLFRGEGVFQVNPIDLIGLEVLRVFEPAVYARLPDAKMLLTGRIEVGFDPREDPESRTRAVESIVEQASASCRPRVREILRQLFPPAAWALGDHSNRSSENSEWYRELRACHADIFDRYFQLALSERDIPQERIDRILSKAGDRHEFVAEILALKDVGLLEEAIDRLTHYQEQIGLDHAVPFITALLDIGDHLPVSPSNVFVNFGPAGTMLQIIHQILKREPAIEKRSEILKAALTDTTGVSLPSVLLDWEENEQERKNRPAEVLLQEADLPACRKSCVEKILHAAEKGTLGKKPGLNFILSGWQRWGGPGAMKTWTEQYARDPAGALALLVSFLREGSSSTSGDFVGRVERKISLKAISEFASINILSETLRQATPINLTEIEGAALAAFKSALQERDPGESGV